MTRRQPIPPCFDVCEECNGDGKVSFEGIETTCPECGGYGCFSDAEDRRLDSPSRGDADVK